MAIANKNFTPELNAGCCEPDHPSNDILKQGWKGETLLFCDGQEIV